MRVTRVEKCVSSIMDHRICVKLKGKFLYAQLDDISQILAIRKHYVQNVCSLNENFRMDEQKYCKT